MPAVSLQAGHRVALSPVNRSTAAPATPRPQDQPFLPMGNPYPVTDPIRKHADGSIGGSEVRCVHIDPKYTRIGTAAETTYKVVAGLPG